MLVEFTKLRYTVNDGCFFLCRDQIGIMDFGLFTRMIVFSFERRTTKRVSNFTTDRRHCIKFYIECVFLFLRCICCKHCTCCCKVVNFNMRNWCDVQMYNTIRRVVAIPPKSTKFVEMFLKTGNHATCDSFSLKIIHASLVHEENRITPAIFAFLSTSHSIRSTFIWRCTQAFGANNTIEFFN